MMEYMSSFLFLEKLTIKILLCSNEVGYSYSRIEWGLFQDPKPEDPVFVVSWPTGVPFDSVNNLSTPQFNKLVSEFDTIKFTNVCPRQLFHNATKPNPKNKK
jgi:hypothetical protein